MVPNQLSAPSGPGTLTKEGALSSSADEHDNVHRYQSRAPVF